MKHDTKVNRCVLSEHFQYKEISCKTAEKIAFIGMSQFDPVGK